MLDTCECLAPCDPGLLNVHTLFQRLRNTHLFTYLITVVDTHTYFRPHIPICCDISMDDWLSFVDFLEIVGFIANARTEVFGFCCENLWELALLPSKDLDAAISNLHKALANVTPARDRVRLCYQVHHTESYNNWFHLND